MYDVLYNADAAIKLREFDDCIVDLTITSPPYDNLRSYHGSMDVFDEDKWKRIIKELFRVTKIGGVVVWVVGDATIKGCETGTSFRQALYFMECGFKLHDTMLYKAVKAPQKAKRYQPCFEYMFVFVRGKINTFNPLKKQNKAAGRKRVIRKRLQRSSVESLTYLSEARVIITPDESPRENIWEYREPKHPDGMKNDHPAVFPDKLADDHILSWSNPGDVVLDCFAGSGTVLLSARKLMRKFIGIEQSIQYCELINKRLEYV